MKSKVEEISNSNSNLINYKNKLETILKKLEKLDSFDFTAKCNKALALINSTPPTIDNREMLLHGPTAYNTPLLLHFYNEVNKLFANYVENNVYKFHLSDALKDYLFKYNLADILNPSVFELVKTGEELYNSKKYTNEQKFALLEAPSLSQGNNSELQA